MRGRFNFWRQTSELSALPLKPCSQIKFSLKGRAYIMASICLLAFRLHNNMRGLEYLTLIVIVSKFKIDLKKLFKKPYRLIFIIWKSVERALWQTSYCFRLCSKHVGKDKKIHNERWNGRTSACCNKSITKFSSSSLRAPVPLSWYQMFLQVDVSVWTAITNHMILS